MNSIDVLRARARLVAEIEVWRSEVKFRRNQAKADGDHRSYRSLKKSYNLWTPIQDVFDTNSYLMGISAPHLIKKMRDAHRLCSTGVSQQYAINRNFKRMAEAACFVLAHRDRLPGGRRP